MKIGSLVRFCSEKNGGPVHRVADVAPGGMVELEDMVGHFAPHLFDFADDIGDIPPGALPVRDTLEAYFERAEMQGVIDFHLRIMRTPEGKLDFYIHPQNQNGETGDFTVSGTSVEKIKNNVAAGSSRQ
ncbi:MAG: hypothetical protein Dbin4_02791 [Alphaproteobacteria bacterium]|nr:hypothetical protein [Alphaproteobacteria bacterium]